MLTLQIRKLQHLFRRNCETRAKSKRSDFSRVSSLWTISAKEESVFLYRRSPLRQNRIANLASRTDCLILSSSSAVMLSNSFLFAFFIQFQ